jgi:hypothetical protein
MDPGKTTVENTSMKHLFVQFVSPGFLFALLAVSIPILIHLFHFRRFRRVFFPNVSFLQQLSDESKKQSRLKHLLVLLARILAITALVLAFSRPYIPVSDAIIGPDGNIVAVYVDNSFSMDAVGTAGRLIDQARTRALEIASVYQPGDRFLLLTNDFEGRHQRFVSREEFMAMTGEIGLSSRIRTLSEVMERKTALFSEEAPGTGSAYFISDFQKSTMSLDGARPDSSLATFLVPVQAQRYDNVFLDSCWFESPVRLAGQTVMMHARIRNDGSQALSGQPVRLFIDGVQRTLASYDIAAGGETDVELGWTIGPPGFYQGWVEIIDYPVSFDDRLYFSYEVRAETPVLSIEQSGESPYLRALFGRDTTFFYRSVPSFSVDFSAFRNFNLIVLNGLQQVSPAMAMGLGEYVNEGGSLLVFPGRDIDLDSYRQLFEPMELDIYSRLDTLPSRVSSINELHQLYRDVFEHLPENLNLPEVTSHYVIAGTVFSRGETLMQMQNGNPFFVHQPVGQGNVFLSAVPLSEDFSNFPRHTIFVPTLYNIALQSKALQPLYHTIGQNTPIRVREPLMRPDQVFRLRGEAMELIPEQRRTGNQFRLLVHDQLIEAGNYRLYAEDKPVKAVSFNYDRRESALEAYDRNELSAVLLDAGFPWIRIIDTTAMDFERAFQEYRSGRQLWRLFLFLALAFLLAEVLLLRFWK